MQGYNENKGREKGATVATIYIGINKKLPGRAFSQKLEKKRFSF